MSNKNALRYGLCKSVVRDIEQIERVVNLALSEEIKISSEPPEVRINSLISRLIRLGPQDEPFHRARYTSAPHKFEGLRKKKMANSELLKYFTRIYSSEFISIRKCKVLFLWLRYSLSQAGHFYHYNTFIGINCLCQHFFYLSRFIVEKTRNVTAQGLLEYINMSLKASSDENPNPIKDYKAKLANFYRKLLLQNEKNYGGLLLICWKELFNACEDYMFEDEEEFLAKWKGYFRQYLALKAKRWRLNENIPSNAHQDSLVCKICAKRFKFEKLPIHSKDCLDHAKEIENFNNNQKQIIKLSEAAVDLRQEITVKASIKR